MPVSKRRPAATRKRAASRRHRAAGKVASFIEAPWLTWQKVHGEPDRPPDALTVLEHMPFRIDWGDRLNWTCLAELSGMLGIDVAKLAHFASLGYLAWLDDYGIAVATVPDR